MKISFTKTYTYDLSEKQIELLKYLNAGGGEYLHDDEADLADKTPGISDRGEGYYYVDAHGKRILAQIP